MRIKDIAERAGVSTAAVSYVLHGKTSHVSAETQKKIEKALEEMNYVPNMGARMLAGKKSRLIGVILQDFYKNDREVITDPFYAEILSSIEAEISANGYYMLLKTVPDESAIQTLAAEWNVDGLIILNWCGITPNKYLALKKKLDKPFLFIDSPCSDIPDLVNIGADDQMGGYLMADYLIQNGHRKIMFLADADDPISGMRFRGIQDAYKEHHTELTGLSYQLLPTAKEDRRILYADSNSRLRNHTALFFVSDYYAAEAIGFLQDAGLRIPEDISIAGYDCSYLGEMCRPQLTTIRQDIRQKGAAAVQMLLSLMSGNKLPHSKMLTEVELIERKSTGRI